MLDSMEVKNVQDNKISRRQRDVKVPTSKESGGYMENRSKLVSRKVRARIVTHQEIDRYFDGQQCLGHNLVKAAVWTYGISRNKIARVFGVNNKTVAKWYRGETIPSKEMQDRLFEFIQAWREMEDTLISKFSQTCTQKYNPRMPKISLPAPLPLVKKAYGVEALDKKVDKDVDQEPLGMDTKVNPVSGGACATQNPLDPAS